MRGHTATAGYDATKKTMTLFAYDRYEKAPLFTQAIFTNMRGSRNNIESSPLAQSIWKYVRREGQPLKHQQLQDISTSRNSNKSVFENMFGVNTSSESYPFL